MSSVLYHIHLTGLRTAPGTLPLVALAALSRTLLEVCERSLRLAVEGASVKRGPVPAWLVSSLDLTFSGVSGGSTVLNIEAPTLGETAPAQVQQQDLWYTLPEPEDTALTLLSRSVADATSEQLESDRFDRGVLNKLLDFGAVLDKRGLRADGGAELYLSCATRPQENFKLGEPQLARIERLRQGTPEPHAVVTSGTFDLIEHTNRRFQLALPDGRRIPGRADASVVTEENMRALWGRPATVKGMAHFNPSGRIRFIVASVIKSMQPGEEILGHLPEAQPPVKVIEGIKRQKPAVSSLREAWGQWPGDESIEDLLSALKETSTETA